MSPNLRPNIFWLQVRTRISQPSICVPTFTQFTNFPVYSATFLPFCERNFDAYLRQICPFDAYLRRSGGFMCQMTASSAGLWRARVLLACRRALTQHAKAWETLYSS